LDKSLERPELLYVFGKHRRRTSDAMHRGASFPTTEIQRYTYYGTKSLYPGVLISP